MLELKSIEDLKGCPRNPRRITGEALAGLKVSLAAFGDIGGLVWNARTGELVAGHQRMRALRMLYGDALRVEGDAVVAPTGERWPVRVVDWDESQAMAALVAANNQAIAGEFDDGLQAILDELEASDAELFAGLRLDELLDDLGPLDDRTKAGCLTRRFGVPPFSVLDTRQGYWKERRQEWLDLGIVSGEGREENLTFSESAQPPALYALRNAMRAATGVDPSWEAVLEEARCRGIKAAGGTSIFDPVLAEIAVRWFCPPGGVVLDPFAGGSVRGIVTGFLGRQYVGIDVRAEQIEANERQARALPTASVPEILPEIRIEQHGKVLVVRDDDVPGGTKQRALELLLPDWPEDEVVYASPAFGFAQVALALACRSFGKRATIFVAKRNEMHAATRAAKDAGAHIVEVENGYLNVVQARAREHCERSGARLIPFGLDFEEFIDALAHVARSSGVDPKEVWCVAGSGVVCRALQRAWPEARIHAVAIGKEPHVGNATLHVAPEEFQEAAKVRPPFPSNSNYDAKAWRFIEEHASEGALFWNVAGDPVHGIVHMPQWIVGDSREAALPEACDLVFSCPPYADLEVYSDDPRDLSTMEFEDFLSAYREIIKRTVATLREDRFAVFVVGDVRDKEGRLRNLPALTVQAFEEAGATFYNDAIILNNAGSAAIRAGGQFQKTRKLARVHQYFLVFLKSSGGDGRKATEAVGAVEFGEPVEEDDS